MTNASRAVITGGAGFVGSHLAAALLDRGTQVVCVDSFITSTPANVAALRPDSGFTLLRQDVSKNLIVDGPVDVVFHLASPASPADYLRYPLETLRAGSAGTMHALELAARANARFVLASTSEVYGDPLRHPQREDYWGNVNPVGMRSVYDEAKRFGETVTHVYRERFGVDTGIARVFNSYGPRMRPNDGRAVPTFLVQALTGAPVTVAGDGSQTRSLCYVTDTVAGLIALADSGAAGPVNIGSEDEVTVLELAHRVRDAVGSTSPIVFIDLPEGDPQRRRPDLTRARELLGWEPTTPLDVGIARTARWFATEGAQRAGAAAGSRGPSSVSAASITSST